MQGYALDAVEAEAAADAAPPAATLEAASAFLAGVQTTRVTQHDGVGLGRDTRFATARATGAGLVAGDELVQLTAFAADGPDAGRTVRRTRIRRPSGRR